MHFQPLQIAEEHQQQQEADIGESLLECTFSIIFPGFLIFVVRNIVCVLEVSHICWVSHYWSDATLLLVSIFMCMFLFLIIFSMQSFVLWAFCHHDFPLLLIYLHSLPNLFNTGAIHYLFVGQFLCFFF